MVSAGSEQPEVTGVVVAPAAAPSNSLVRRKATSSLANTVRSMTAPVHKPWYIIDPRSAKLLPFWDGFATVALLFTATATPYEVAFLPPSRYPWLPWFILNRIVDFVFITDFILQFLLGYMETASRDQAAQWIFAPRRIARRYVTSAWFPLDVLSLSVASLDFIELDVVQQQFDVGESFGNLKVLRVLRALRLIKLVRLVRGSKILQRWEVRYAINYGYLAMTKTVGKVFFLCHVFACLWALQAGFQDTKLDSWMGSTGGYARPCTMGAPVASPLILTPSSPTPLISFLPVDIPILSVATRGMPSS